MSKSNHYRLVSMIVVVVLILASVFLSGCLNDDGGTVGIPEGENPEGDIYEDHVEIFVPIMNTYEEPKQIVMKFEVGTEEGGRHSEMKYITLPEDSVDVYNQIVDIPENETPDFVDTEIIVWYEETKIVEVDGEYSEGNAALNATIANTKFESERVLVEFIVTTEEDIYSEIEELDVAKSSMEIYTEDVGIPPDEDPVSFDAQKI